MSTIFRHLITNGFVCFRIITGTQINITIRINWRHHPGNFRRNSSSRVTQMSWACHRIVMMCLIIRVLNRKQIIRQAVNIHRTKCNQHIRPSPKPPTIKCRQQNIPHTTMQILMPNMIICKRIIWTRVGII